MKPTVYVETAIVSYLKARRSNDELRNGQVELTRQWWSIAPQAFELFTSDLVSAEASAGDPAAAAERLMVLSTLPLLPIVPAAETLADALLREMALPLPAQRDALHVVITATNTAANTVQYLLTWNCRHLANATLRSKIERVCLSAGFRPPTICTPQELLEVFP